MHSKKFNFSCFSQFTHAVQMSLSHQQFLLTVLEIQAVTSIPQNLHKTFVIEESVQEMETSSPDWPLPAPSNFFFLAPINSYSYIAQT